DLANNPISDLTPLSGLTQLEYLCLEMSWDTTDYNRNHEALSTLTNLRFLVLNNNFISDLSFLSELTSLEYLYLDGNQISDLSRLSALTKLGMLELNHNQISDLTPLYGLFGLAEYDNCSRLSLHGNPLTVEQVDELIAVLGADRQLIRFNPDYPYYYCYDCRQNDCICNEIPEKPEKPVIIPSPEGILTAELLQAIRNSGAVVTIELPCGMLITIDPRTVKPNVQDVPISVEIESGGSHADGIPNNSIIILPSAQGEFGFEFSFDITAEQLAEAGLNIDNAQLFYVNGNGITQQHGELTRNSDGSVTITIDRASSYVLAAVTHGDVTGTGAVTIADVLEILKSLAGMSSVIDDNVIALQAALIVNPTATKPSIADALEILKHLAGMKSVLAN
ncbi:MAG: leucine-rich repeat domain-containing protein, partial [Oscillospiraceae bacterium]|nr:leucine-rich repeat domain-containing protein [Oscillospiraceae bacterium]